MPMKMRTIETKSDNNDDGNEDEDSNNDERLSIRQLLWR